MTPGRGETLARWPAEYQMPKPDLRKRTPYIFGCEVQVLREKDDRGPHGSIEAGRTYTALYLGMTERGYVVSPAQSLPLSLRNSDNKLLAGVMAESAAPAQRRYVIPSARGRCSRAGAAHRSW